MNGIALDRFVGAWLISSGRPFERIALDRLRELLAEPGRAGVVRQQHDVAGCASRW